MASGVKNRVLDRFTSQHDEAKDEPDPYKQHHADSWNDPDRENWLERRLPSTTGGKILVASAILAVFVVIARFTRVLEPLYGNNLAFAALGILASGAAMYIKGRSDQIDDFRDHVMFVGHKGSTAEVWLGREINDTSSRLDDYVAFNPVRSMGFAGLTYTYDKIYNFPRNVANLVGKSGRDPSDPAILGIPRDQCGEAEIDTVADRVYTMPISQIEWNYDDQDVDMLPVRETSEMDRQTAVRLLNRLDDANARIIQLENDRRSLKTQLKDLRGMFEKHQLPEYERGLKLVKSALETLEDQEQQAGETTASEAVRDAVKDLAREDDE